MKIKELIRDLSKFDGDQDEIVAVFLDEPPTIVCDVVAVHDHNGNAQLNIYVGSGEEGE